MKSLSRVRLFATQWIVLGFSVHGILQARILEWIAISFSRGSSWPRDRTRVSRIGGRCFNLWATREGLLKLKALWLEEIVDIILCGENHEWYVWTQMKLSDDSVHAVNVIIESDLEWQSPRILLLSPWGN